MNRIKQLRLARNMKQTELCQMLGITQGALSGWENERFEPDISSLVKMAKIFECDLDYLLGLSPSAGFAAEVSEGTDNVLWQEIKSLGPEDKKDVLDYVRFKKSKGMRNSL